MLLYKLEDSRLNFFFLETDIDRLSISHRAQCFDTYHFSFICHSQRIPRHSSTFEQCLCTSIALFGVIK